ncbi:hypothetical protein KFL_012250010 [Klebsormidium nitens]|uniref:Uncharacterized protein n=1 Tax=Klebsormidium nitens TaxID=105231 RepID=A0A1Y1IUD7_KLENI|nr:hypothetical protein KFL_012250010 [Klebsormidium nitens]|eukprot:GAQ92961.1 hypothetical protein KFL_012250010 [Klebsormidium nitens]
MQDNVNGSNIIREAGLNIAPPQHRYEEKAWSKRSTQGVYGTNGVPLSPEHVATLQEGVIKCCGDEGARVELLADKKGGQKLQISVTDDNTFFKIIQGRVSVTLPGGKKWVLHPKRGELGPTTYDPMALVVDGINLPNHIRASDILGAVAASGADKDDVSVEEFNGPNGRAFLVETYDETVAARIWLGAANLPSGKKLVADLAYFWKSDVLKTQIPSLDQRSAFDVLVRDNGRLLAAIMQARNHFKRTSRGLPEYIVEEPEEKKPKRLTFNN